ncbi:MAG: DUF2141 domain-containing protein, partial [Shewanella sp.]|nr:DUF2141 domain-containing protein [Shewanella sp.]
EASRMKQVNHQNEALRFETLEEGEYVLRYFHDQNGNQQHDRNLFGMPTEGYGFSNSAQPNFGAPDYQAIKFTVSETGITQNISHVIYH